MRDRKRLYHFRLRNSAPDVAIVASWSWVSKCMYFMYVSLVRVVISTQDDVDDVGEQRKKTEQKMREMDTEIH